MANFLGQLQSGMQGVGNFANNLSNAMGDVQLNTLRFDNPAAYAEIKTRDEELKIRQAERAQQIAQQKAFEQTMKNPVVLGTLSQRFGLPQEVLSSARSMDELSALGRLVQPESSPSAVQEYEYYNSLPPEAQSEYLKIKRAEKVLDLGGQYAAIDPRTGAPAAQYEKTLAPSELPQTKADQAQAVANVEAAMSPGIAEETARRKAQAEAEVQAATAPSIEAKTQEASVLGKERGASAAKLESMTANMPKVQKFVSDLRDLANTATYTKGGQLVDAIMRETGQTPREGAVAREKFQAKINNEVLPLLRETFGAAFTVQEGESLRATLGDINKSPIEKQAALDAFIEAKVGEIESLQRRNNAPNADLNGQPTNQQSDLGRMTTGGGGTRKRYNPATGRVE